MIDFYCGINEAQWNRHPVNPGSLVCISPIYGASMQTKRVNNVKIPLHSAVIQDSGAFSDGPGDRLSFAEALNRQRRHGQKYGYADQVAHRASYDLLIDEVWTNGNRHKRRWSENDAWAAVAETVRAAEYLAKNYNEARVQSAQGVTVNQYLECTMRIMEWFDTEQDIFGLGGWCISGKLPLQIRPAFNEIMLIIIPFLAKANVKKTHIWGVSDVSFLGPLLWLCDKHGLKLSTDSSAPSRRPAFGEWGFRSWRNPNYKRVGVGIRGIHRAIHVQLFRCRLNTLRQSEFYHHPNLPDEKAYQRRLI